MKPRIRWLQPFGVWSCISEEWVGKKWVSTSGIGRTISEAYASWLKWFEPKEKAK